MTQNRFVIALKALGQALVGDINGPHRKKITPMDVHSMNGYIVIDGVNYSPDEATALVVEILRRLPKE